MSDATAAPPAPVVLAEPLTLGDPLALGLASFGISALVLAAINAGWIESDASAVVLPLALALGFLTEIIAGVLHFRRGETFAGTVFTAYAGFWLAYGLFGWIFGPLVKGHLPHGLGWFLLAWAIFTTYMLLASLRTTRTIALIFALLFVTFWVITIGVFTSNADIVKFSGYVLAVDAAVALFLSAAAIVNDTWGRTVIPAP